MIITYANAQPVQTVKGTVRDAETGYPLSGAQIVVKIKGADKKLFGAVSDFDGKYEIRDVPVGTISVSCSFMGYEKQTFSPLELLAGKELVVDFYLKEKLTGLDEVVVKVNKKSERATFSTASYHEMKAVQMNRYAGSLADVGRMAMNYAGVSVNNDTRNDIIVRGNNPSTLLWNMEGIYIPSPNHYSAEGSSGGPVSMINSNVLGKVNFFTGAFPANFGNTTSAVFDLSFRSGNADKWEFLGQIGFAGAEIGMEGPLSGNKKNSFLANYRYSTLDLFHKMGIDFGAGTAVPRYQDLSFVLNFPDNRKGNLRVWGIAGTSKIRFLTSDEGGDNLYLDYESSDLKTNNKTVILGANRKYFINKSTSLSAAFSFGFEDQNVTLDTLNTDSGLYENFYNHLIIKKSVSGKIEYKTKLNKRHILAAGMEHTTYFISLNMNIHKPAFEYGNDLFDRVGLTGLYLNYKYKFGDNWVLRPGIRWQYLDLTKEISTEPRMGISYDFSSHSQVYLAYGLHSSMHSLLAYFSKHDLNGEVKYYNKDLKFTKSHHFVLGTKQLIGRKLHLKAELYYQYLFHVPVDTAVDRTYSIINAGYDKPGGVQIYFRPLVNEGQGKNLGLDITLERRLNRGFYLLFTGSLYQSFYKAADGVWRHTAWDGTFTTSLLTGKEFKLSNKSALSFDLNMVYSGGRRYTPIDKAASAAAGEAVYDVQKAFSDRLPDYARTDVKISYRLNGKHVTQEWQLDLRNVFNRRNIFSLRYNKYKNEVEYMYQTGFFPVMQYRVLF